MVLIYGGSIDNFIDTRFVAMRNIPKRDFGGSWQIQHNMHEEGFAITIEDGQLHHGRWILCSEFVKHQHYVGCPVDSHYREALETLLDHKDGIKYKVWLESSYERHQQRCPYGCYNNANKCRVRDGYVFGAIKNMVTSNDNQHRFLLTSPDQMWSTWSNLENNYL